MKHCYLHLSGREEGSVVIIFHYLLFAMPDFQCSSLQVMRGTYALFSLYNVEFASRNNRSWYHSGFCFLGFFFTLSSKHGKMGKMCQLSLIFLSEGGL